MKDLVETKLCLSLELECIPLGILANQSTFVRKIVEKFNMDKSYPLNNYGVSDLLSNRDKYPFVPNDGDEEIVEPRLPIIVQLEH